MSLSPFRSRLGVDAVFGAGWAALMFVGWALVIAPAQTAQERRAERERHLAHLKTQAVEMEQAVAAQQRRLAEVEAQVAQSHVRLLPVSGLNQRIADLTAMADELGGGLVKIEQIVPGTPKPAARFTAVPIQIIGLATYPGAQSLLRRLHTRFSDTGVAAFSLSAGEGSATAAFKLELVWYAAPASPAGRAGSASRAGGAGAGEESAR
jgi:hypothetical protein